MCSDRSIDKRCDEFRAAFGLGGETRWILGKHQVLKREGASIGRYNREGPTTFTKGWIALTCSLCVQGHAAAEYQTVARSNLTAFLMATVPDADHMVALSEHICENPSCAGAGVKCTHVLRVEEMCEESAASMPSAHEEFVVGLLGAALRPNCPSLVRGFQEALSGAAQLGYHKALTFRGSQDQVTKKNSRGTVKRKRAPECVKENLANAAVDEADGLQRGVVHGTARRVVKGWEDTDSASALLASKRWCRERPRRGVTILQEDGTTLGHPGRETYVYISKRKGKRSPWPNQDRIEMPPVFLVCPTPWPYVLKQN